MSQRSEFYEGLEEIRNFAGDIVNAVCDIDEYFGAYGFPPENLTAAKYRAASWSNEMPEGVSTPELMKTLLLYANALYYRLREPRNQ